MDNQITDQEISTAPVPPALESGTVPSGLTPEQKRNLIIAVVVLVLIVIGVGVMLYYLLTTNPLKTAQIRDVFIIVLAVQSLLIGLVMVILIVQLARLINLLQNEIRPILDSTNETVSNLRGTTVFLSDNIIEPIIKMNEYMAGFTELLATIGLLRRTGRRKESKGE
jgi:hypothetical protein